ncbi:MAG: response regulator [bacterium]|nr:response regulator [bacterium]
MENNKILVVDDDEGIRKLFVEVFTQYGFNVSSAENGKDALALLEDEKIQVMFLDLKMPGMSGVELCGRIRRKYPDAQIFAVTGFFNEFEPDDLKNAGFNEYFFKPVVLTELVETAQKAFASLSTDKTER